MTIREFKDIDRQIRWLKAKYERLKADAVNISPKLSDTPRGGSVTDKLGGLIAQIDDTRNEIDRLTAFRKAELSRLSKQSFEENCIYLFLARRWSWYQIANEIDGRPDTADSIRMRCRKYNW